MTGFSAEWLRLRNSPDNRSRCAALTRWLEQWRSGLGELTIADLGAGTGANFRYLAPRLGGDQRWRLVDSDAGLLNAFPQESRAAGWEVVSCGTRWQVRGPDFSADVCLIRSDIGDDPDKSVAGADLVTASALLDLVSPDWLGHLAALVVERRAAGLFVLNYNGMFDFSTPDPGDAVVRQAFNRHQRGNKGMGPALGPDAVAALSGGLEKLGRDYRVRPSDWRLTVSDRALAAELVRGFGVAALEICPELDDTVQQWTGRRLGMLASGMLTVGHLDLLTLPG